MLVYQRVPPSEVITSSISFRMISGLVGGVEHGWIMTFQKQLGMETVGNGMSSSQLTIRPSFFRGVGLNHQPENVINHH